MRRLSGQRVADLPPTVASPNCTQILAGLLFGLNCKLDPCYKLASQPVQQTNTCPTV